MSSKTYPQNHQYFETLLGIEIQKNFISVSKKYHPTWHKWILLLVIGIAVLYGAWFDYLDSLRYCLHPTSNNIKCESNSVLPIGTMLGGNAIYQPWNIIGHAIPTLFLLFYSPKKWEYALVGFLISTVVMDTPLWGVDVLYTHPNQDLWKENGVPTHNLWEWIAFYYNPIGTYGVWGGWYPPAWLMFWSVAGRIAVAIGLILYQHKREKVKGRRLTFRIVQKRFRLIDLDEKIR